MEKLRQKRYAVPATVAAIGIAALGFSKRSAEAEPTPYAASSITAYSQYEETASAAKTRLRLAQAQVASRSEHRATPKKTAEPKPKATPTPTHEATAPKHGAYSAELVRWLHLLGKCESGNNPKTNTGNGYYGEFQFSDATWDSLHTGYARADLAPESVQEAAIIANTNRSSEGLASQNPGCYQKEHLSQFPPK